MKRIAIIENGVVKNIIIKNDSDVSVSDFIVDNLNVSVGDLFDGNNFTKPEKIIINKTPTEILQEKLDADPELKQLLQGLL